MKAFSRRVRVRRLALDVGTECSDNVCIHRICTVSCHCPSTSWTIEFVHRTNANIVIRKKINKIEREYLLVSTSLSIAFIGWPWGSIFFHSKIYCPCSMQTSVISLNIYTHTHTSTLKRKKEWTREREKDNSCCIFSCSLRLSFCLDRGHPTTQSALPELRCENERWTSWRQHLFTESWRQRESQNRHVTSAWCDCFPYQHTNLFNKYNIITHTGMYKHE